MAVIMATKKRAPRKKPAAPVQADLQRMLASDCPIVVAFSGGKDSVAMVLYLLFVLRIPAHRIVLHHQNVDGEGPAWFDWPITRAYCEAFAAAFGLRYLEQYREGGIMGEACKVEAQSGATWYQDEAGAWHKLEPAKHAKVSTRRMYPMVGGDMQKRWCSSTAKMEPHHRALRQYYPVEEYEQVLVCTGERWQESTKRQKLHGLEWHKCDAKARRMLHWRPVIDWQEQDVWAIMEEHKVQPHPCYVLGWGRASCMTCIFNSANHWAALLEMVPERVEAMHAKEVEFGRTLYQDETIMERALRGQSVLAGVAEEVLEQWLPVALGEQWSQPIIVEQWQMPAGAYSSQSCGAV